LTVLLLLVVAGGCAWGDERAARNSPTRSGANATKARENYFGQSQGATLRMASGHSTARFKITALAPPTHVFDVRIVAPASADVRVRMRTSNGRLLRILDSTRIADWCQVRRSRSVCLLMFPLLEAQREGLWTVIVRKRSDPAATVRVASHLSESLAARPQAFPPLQLAERTLAGLVVSLWMEPREQLLAAIVGVLVGLLAWLLVPKAVGVI
jgi:hypothetical protein